MRIRKMYPMDVKVGDTIVEDGRPDELVTAIFPPDRGQVWTFHVTLPNGQQSTHSVGSRAAILVQKGVR